MIEILLFLFLGLCFNVGWHHYRIKQLELHLDRLARAIATYYDAEKLCELTAEMVMEASPRIKRRSNRTPLTVVKGPKQ
jgi:hypothetical protein